MNRVLKMTFASVCLLSLTGIAAAHHGKRAGGCHGGTMQSYSSSSYSMTRMTTTYSAVQVQQVPVQVVQPPQVFAPAPMVQMQYTQPQFRTPIRNLFRGRACAG